VVEAGWRAELATKTTEILGRYGVAGRVQVEGQLVWLIGHGPTVEVGLSELATTSAAQSPGELQRLAERLARDLANARRHALGKSDDSSDIMGWLKLLPPLIFFVLVVGFAVRYLLPSSGRPKPASTRIAASAAMGAQKTDSLGQQGKADRDYRSCIETVTRIQRGGSVTALDADGWVVELSLIIEKAELDPSLPLLREYFEIRPGGIERTQTWPSAPALRQIPSSVAGVLVSKEPLALAAPAPGTGLKITWRGQYAALFFKEAEHREFMNLSDALYLDTKATYGALYARCAQGVARYLGAWFRGPTVGGAVWALVAEMDVFSDVPQIPNVRSGDGPEQWKLPLNRMATLTRSLTRKQVALMLANTEGAVSESPGQYATIVFPFGQGSRANSASTKFVNAMSTR